jgi:hypothetical protein
VRVLTLEGLLGHGAECACTTNAIHKLTAHAHATACLVPRTVAGKLFHSGLPHKAVNPLELVMVSEAQQQWCWSCDGLNIQ